MEFSGVDLNLLVSLDALLDECNVTKAALRLHISQPALSGQLAKLRLLFNDPLLLPAESGRGMTPTARALSLRGPLRSALKTLGAVIHSEPSFDPYRNARTFQVAIGDTATAVIGLPLIELLAKGAGDQVQVTFSISDPDAIATHMEEGEIDLLIDAERSVPENVKMRILQQQPFVMAQRKGHPRGTGPLDLDTYCSLRHVVVSPTRRNVRGYMDEYLERLGKRRNTVLSVPQFIMVPEILRTSDYVSTLPQVLLARSSEVVDMFDLPFAADPFALAIAWHPRNHEDPAVKWLRELVIAASAGAQQA